MSLLFKESLWPYSRNLWLYDYGLIIQGIKLWPYYSRHQTMALLFKASNYGLIIQGIKLWPYYSRHQTMALLFKASNYGLIIQGIKLWPYYSRNSTMAMAFLFKESNLKHWPWPSIVKTSYSKQLHYLRDALVSLHCWFPRWRRLGVWLRLFLSRLETHFLFLSLS